MTRMSALRPRNHVSMTSSRYFFFAMLVLGLLTSRAEAQAQGAAAAPCEGLVHDEFSDVIDAPAYVTLAKLVAPDDTVAVEYCEVRGYIAPTVEFVLRLPAAHWNGKLLELGCGGACGSTNHIARCDEALRRGYACIVSDGGHKSNASDMGWATQNSQAAIDYFVRASHVTALAGKAIVARYYSRKPNRSYFMGCSAGGIQAMWEAERFPWDFDGIAAGGPASQLSSSWMSWVWNHRALMGTDGKPILSAADLQLLHSAVVAKCDLNDGVKDGVIGDPRECKFDPSELLCTNGKSSNCLSAQQAEAAAKIYDGPTTSKGERVAPPLALRGSELSWSMYRESKYIEAWYHYSVYPINLGQAWKPEDLNFDEDYKRVGLMEILEPFSNPNLRRFKAVGGKLLVYSGWNDAIEGVLNTVGYIETVEKFMGGRDATQDFMRLFVIPGMSHCSGGDGAFDIDYLSYLEDWVERGHAPDKIIGAHVKTEAMDSRREQMYPLGGHLFPLDPNLVEFSRPIYPYPIKTKYLGHGDPKDAASFGPVPR